MQARVESMAGQQYGLDRDYGDYPRLQMRNKGLYEAILYGGATPSKAVQNSKKVPFSDADERFFSPATRRVLKAERKFYADLERLNKQ
jgi:hypothetical protein